MALIAALAAITNGVAPPHVHIITTIAAIILTTVNPVVAYHFFLILFLACHTTLRDIDIRELALNTPSCLTIAGYRGIKNSLLSVSPSSSNDFLLSTISCTSFLVLGFILENVGKSVFTSLPNALVI